MALAPGQILQNRYRIVSLLGEGGMGAVYQAWDTRLDVHVAVKEMTSQPGIDDHVLDQCRQQFLQEAKILAQLNHPHLVRVGDFFEERDNLYLVMDFVDGESLADCIDQDGALPEHQVREWASQLLDALAYCHSRGVIHRDIKPHNVIIRTDGCAVLVDFGLVKLWDPVDPCTRTAMRGMGTPEYAPPEQYGTDTSHTDTRSDIYSLGATLYHALTGHAPPVVTIRIVNPGALAPVHVHASGVSPRTEAALAQAMELQPAARFQSAQEMMSALMTSFAPQAVQPTAGTSALATTKVLPRTQSVHSESRQTRRWLWVVGGVALLGGLLALGNLGSSLWLGVEATQTPAESLTETPAQALSAPTLQPTTTIQPTATSQSTPTIQATPTTAPTATAANTATPSPPPTPVPTPVATYQTVPLTQIANASLGFEAPPTGNVTLGGVPFHLSNGVFKSQASSPPNDGYPTNVTLLVNVPQAYRVHLLLNTGNGFTQFNGKTIGQIVAQCNGDRFVVADLQLGRDVREWHAAQNVVSTASHARQVWDGALAGSPNLAGYIDMLSVDLPSACLEGGLATLEITDSSFNMVNSLDPALNLIGVTVEHYQ